jgi:hypothetical protein
VGTGGGANQLARLVSKLAEPLPGQGIPVAAAAIRAALLRVARRQDRVTLACRRRGELTTTPVPR